MIENGISVAEWAHKKHSAPSGNLGHVSDYFQTISPASKLLTSSIPMEHTHVSSAWDSPKPESPLPF